MLAKIEPKDLVDKVKEENAMQEAHLFLVALSHEMRINIYDSCCHVEGKVDEKETVDPLPTCLKGVLMEPDDKQEKSKIKREAVEEILPDDCRPSKRPRLIPEVLLYTWSAIKERKESYKKIKALKNPKMKTMKNLEISLDSIYDRLKPYGLNGLPIGLDLEIQHAMVSRQFMSDVYGGNSIVVFPKIGAEKFAIHGMDDFMYLNAWLQTYAPQLPGRNGLFFHTQIDAWQTDEVMRLFTRIEPGKWLYVGMYVDLPSFCLSKDEWHTLPPQARNAWVAQISKRPWGEGLRARVVARRDLGRNPTYAEWQAVLDNERYKLATSEDVERALNNGEENLQVSVMKCVGYDEPFQREIVERFANWVPPPPNQNKKKKKKASPRVKTEPKTEVKNESVTLTRSQGKRKRDGTVKIVKDESSSSIIKGEDKYELKDVVCPQETKNRSKTVKRRSRPVLEFSDDEEDVLTYVPRGTRSRPICL